MKKILALVCAALVASVSIANAAHRHRHYGYRGGSSAAAAHFQNQFNKNTY
jgi:hypothetical protein